MAVNIDTVYQKVLMFANKEQRGYITPQEFNLFADQAQLEIFEQYFYDINKLAGVGSNNSKEYGDIIDNVNEKIAIFETTGTITNDALPGDVYRLGTVHNISGVELEEVQPNELLYFNLSPLTAPSSKRPVYTRVDGNNIKSHPTDTNLKCNYIKKPSKPNWSYVVVNGKAMYDGTNVTHFDLHASEETELVYKILKFAGVAMVRDDVMKIGQGLETSQIAQEQ